MNICIVGTGYVGLVAAACFAEMGNVVQCVDSNALIIEELRKGRVHIFEPGLEEFVTRNAVQGRLHFTTDLSRGIEQAKVVFIAVGTPSLTDGSCDLCHVHQVAEEIGKTMTSPLIIVDKSTVPVGTADAVRGIIAGELEKRGADIAFDVVANPEFLKEGDAVQDFMKPDRVVLGTENTETEAVMRSLYAPFARTREKLIVMGIRSAEMTKYAANCLLATKISFINEVAAICEKVDADVKDVRAGIGSDHRIGYHFIYPGVGYGGSCFPKDVRALINTGKEHGHPAKVLTAVDEVNSAQKLVVAKKVEHYFAAKGGVSGKTLALWGLAFKANTDDVREASSLEIIKALTAQGMRIRAYDPVAVSNTQKALGNTPLVEFVQSEYDALKGADALAVITEWNQFRRPDFVKIKETLATPVIFDGRNLYSPKELEKQGFHYFGIGR